MPIDVVANVKQAFFDSSKVTKSLDRATKKALSKFGAFVRQRSRSSIRSRKKVSMPGQPPSSHVGTLKKLIFFAYESEQKTVVIGPTPFGKGTAPSLLESGGIAVSRNGKRLNYRPRPFMKPAFDTELAKKPAEFWKDEMK
jgi:hypothetical protein